MDIQKELDNLKAKLREVSDSDILLKIENMLIILEDETNDAHYLRSEIALLLSRSANEINKLRGNLAICLIGKMGDTLRMVDAMIEKQKAEQPNATDGLFPPVKPDKPTDTTI